MKKREKMMVAVTVVVGIFFLMDRFVWSDEEPTPQVKARPTASKKPARTSSRASSRKSKPSKKKMTRGRLVKRADKVVFASWGRDPFEGTHRLLPPDSTILRSVDELRLKAIAYKDGVPYVLIGDYILRPGEGAGPLRLIQVYKDRAITRLHGQLYTFVLETDENKRTRTEPQDGDAQPDSARRLPTLDMEQALRKLPNVVPGRPH